MPRDTPQLAAGSFIEPVKLNTQTRPWECDVHAIRRSTIKKKRNDSVARFIMILAIVFFLVGLLTEGTFVAWAAICFVISGVLYWRDDGKEIRVPEIHVWVECKNLKSKVNRDHIIKLTQTVKRIRMSKNATWKPDKVLFFSAPGYVNDAIYFAKRSGVVCYEKRGDTFEEIT